MGRLYFAAWQGTEGWSERGPSGPHAETGGMQGTPHGVPGHQPIRERTAVMGTGGADRKEIIAALHEQHDLFSNVARQHAPVGKAIDRNALRKVGTGRTGLRCAHDELQQTTPRPYHLLGVIAATAYIYDGCAK